jgi:hypothetical protein
MKGASIAMKGASIELDVISYSAVSQRKAPGGCGLFFAKKRRLLSGDFRIYIFFLGCRML